MTEKKMMGYYDEIDIELEETLLRSGFVDEVFYLKDLQQRKMYLTDEISQATVTDIIRHIMQINREDMGLPIENRKPIILYISSKGGDERSGYGLIDAIENSATPVYTVNIGYEYSMAFLIGLAMQLAVLCLPPLQLVFGTVVLTLPQWGTVLGLALTPVAVCEIVKAVGRSKKRIGSKEPARV